MQFLSPEFAGFFLCFLTLYWSCRAWPRVQNLMVLAAGYVILGSLNLYFALELIAYTLAIHTCSYLIVLYRDQSRTGLILALGMALLNLAFFKYFNFFRDSANDALSAVGLEAWLPAWHVLAPLGISFYTFHSISYLVSLQRRELPQAKLQDLALFLGFFPSVISGPINRATTFMPQITAGTRRSPAAYPKALLLIVLAIFKVVWLSSFLGDTWVDPVFANPAAFHVLDLLLGAFAYTWQIYLNFSGYTDLVTGMALLLGFQLPPNFNAPYLATNLRHFWERWHISLSTWIRDYIYIPLGGSHRGFSRTQANLLVAMLLSGLWHGAGANFLIWGLLHGVGMMWLHASDRWLGRDRLAGAMPVLANTLTVLYVTFAWIFFRCETPGQSLEFVTALFTNTDLPLQFNPLYLAGMWVVFRLYPWLARATQAALDHVGELHWLLLPPVLAALAWFGITLAPDGIPTFIYASF